MHSIENKNEIGTVERRALLDIAREAIVRGVEGGRLTVDVDVLAPALRMARATFVTVTVDEMLRGCIGTLEPYRPLAVDVAENAYAAAFRDPRFPPITAPDLDRLAIHISLLNPPEPIQCSSESDLIRQLRPGIDGLILTDRGRRATFLPSVWESVGDPREFLRHLKLKAGLPPDDWSPTIRAERYTVSSIP